MTYALAAASVLGVSRAASAQSGGETEDVCPEPVEGKDELCGHALGAIALMEGAQAGAGEPEEAQTATDITHVFLNIEVTLSPNQVSGTVTHDVTSKTNGLTQLTLDLRSNMTVDAVRVNGAPQTYSRPGHQLVVNLGQTFNNGQSFQVEVDYHGLPQTLGFDNMSFVFQTHSGTSIVSSLSQPYYAHTWWPCKEDISDKFTLDLWMTAPSWMTAVSNGALQGTDSLSGSRKRTRWRENHPITVYLVAVAMTNYSKTTWFYNYAPGLMMPVELYLYPESQASVLPQVADLVQMIATLSDPGCFGQYPFLDEKYGIAQFNWCCGIEHQTLTFQGTFPERRNVHELAHSWFGDHITCKTWHHVWIQEGWARYAESLWHEKKPGGSYAAYLSHMNTYRPSSYGGTVYRYDISTPSAIFSTNDAYNKGSWVMHMLRHVVGDADFFGALATYRSLYDGIAATTEDWQSVIEGE